MLRKLQLDELTLLAVGDNQQLTTKESGGVANCFQVSSNDSQNNWVDKKSSTYRNVLHSILW